ncbi:MAG: TIGR01777 family oxidoreductase [Planctomycetota bacterium]
MAQEQFSWQSELACSASELYDWHMRPGAFERLSPPWEVVHVERWVEPQHLGDGPTMRLKMGPIWLRWIAKYTECVPGQQFRDVAVKSPFAAWDHLHLCRPSGSDQQHSSLEDRVSYALPGGLLGKLVAGRSTRKQLQRMFAYRHRTTIADLAAHQQSGVKAMKILVSGASGMVGQALIPFLTSGGHQVVQLVRGKGPARPASGGSTAAAVTTVNWDPDRGTIDLAALEGIDAVVHLGGAGIADRRWTPAYKELIKTSREVSTRVLSEALAKLKTPTQVFVCASAIGMYQDEGDKWIDEQSKPSNSYLGQVCQVWEGATKAAADRGIRVVNLRIGVVLSARGGALAKMLLPFKLGAGGNLGSGRQYMSWVAIDDVLGVILHAIQTESLRGPVNVVSPQPVTNADYTKTLGRVLGRPTIFPMPAFAARLAFGEMADALLLASQRIKPSRLIESNYKFRYPELEDALRYQLGRIKA